MSLSSQRKGCGKRPEQAHKSYYMTSLGLTHSWDIRRIKCQPAVNTETHPIGMKLDAILDHPYMSYAEVMPDMSQNVRAAHAVAFTSYVNLRHALSTSWCLQEQPFTVWISIEWQQL